MNKHPLILVGVGAVAGYFLATTLGGYPPYSTLKPYLPVKSS